MSRPDDISEEVWDSAWSMVPIGEITFSEAVELVARAILNERNNAAKIADEYAAKCSEAQKQAFDQGNDYKGNMHWSAQNTALELSQAIRNGGK